MNAFIGDRLPADLEPYRSQPYTLSRRREDALNTTPGPPAVSAPKTPRPLQRELAAEVVRSLHHRQCAHLSAEVGVGKTGAAILAVRTYLAEHPAAEVLVIVDRPADSTITAWRESLAAFGDGGLRWLIISPDQLGKLLGPRNVPLIDFDAIVVDESQNYRHPSDRTKRMRALTRMFTRQRPALLTITATLGHLPSEYLALAPHIASARGESVTAWRDVGARLIELGHPLEPSRFRAGDYMWSQAARNDVSLQQRSTEEVQRWLLRADPPAMVYREAPWGAAKVQAIGVDLSPAQHRDYEMAWTEFRRANEIARSGNDSDAGLAALLRLRQKASFLRTAQTAELAIAQVRKGRQVVVSVNLVSTAADPIADAIESAGIACARIYGDNPVEAERMAFQLGHKPVAVLNKTAAISLHSGEEFADGRRATSTPRIGIFHAPVAGIAAKQTVGRTHRDGVRSPWFLLYGRGTIEENAAKVMAERAQSASASGGGSVQMWTAIASAFGVEWLTSPEIA
ncbi:DEAD/DEAH box helicase family protein [Gordonia alkanivorans]|uniref:DEAD/DEAH box helicase family protein n=1 Tax=Gordonia alkanivorans TaxID=84096 RepID=UPI0004AF1C26|nr:DEAD/DEAH box helicase family protein [Gordonia alkanivorans]